MAAVAVKHPAFQELNTEVLALSVDSVDSHRRWNEVEISHMVDGGIRFPMLSDPQGSIGTLYGVFDEEKRVDSRARFIVDPEGILQGIEVIADVAGRNVTEILRQLQALQHHRATGAFMPCGWSPGKPTISSDGDAEETSPKISQQWKTRNAFS